MGPGVEVLCPTQLRTVTDSVTGIGSPALINESWRNHCGQASAKQNLRVASALEGDAALTQDRSVTGSVTTSAQMQ